MLGWLYRIIIGHFRQCNHVWEMLSEKPWEKISFTGRHPYVEYAQRCLKCGDIRHKNISGWGRK